MQLVDSANHGAFTNAELARLAAYRAAVAAGFYTDWDGSAESTDTQVLASLGQAAAGAAETVAYPFSAEERRRLELARAAVAAGAYSDELPS